LARQRGGEIRAPQLYDDVPGNVLLDFLWGEPQKVAEAFAKAAHVTKLSLRNTRVVVAAMEPRAAVCSYEAERFTLTCQSQGVFALRNQLADILGVKQENVRLRHAERRRLVRHEGLDLSRVRGLAHCGEGRWAAVSGPTSARARSSPTSTGPRPRDDGRAGARRAGQIFSVASAGPRQRRRVGRHGGAAAAT